MAMNLTVDWDCNWKASVDAFNEYYHTPCIHPELSYLHDDVDVQIESLDTPERNAFSEISKREGLKAAIAWRDARFSDA